MEDSAQDASVVAAFFFLPLLVATAAFRFTPPPLRPRALPRVTFGGGGDGDGDEDVGEETLDPVGIYVGSLAMLSTDAAEDIDDGDDSVREFDEERSSSLSNAHRKSCVARSSWEEEEEEEYV